MNFLITEIAVSLLIAFVIGCVLTWLWRGQQLRRRVAEAERIATQRGQVEMASLHAEIDSRRAEIAELHDENEKLSTQISESEGPILIASSAEESENLKAKLVELKNRHAALHSRWERERTQFAQLVTHKNNQIASLERQNADSDQAIIEDGTSVDTDDDARSYSRQQLESMVVDMRAKVAEQESELGELRALRDSEGSQRLAGSQAIGLMGTDTSDSDLLNTLAERDAEIVQLKSSLTNADSGPRLVEVEQERANLLHRISELSGLRANDAEHTARLHSDLEALRTETQQARDQLGSLKQTKETLEQQCEALQAELSSTRERAQQMPALEARCTQLSDDITTLQSLLDNTTSERDNALSRMESAQSSLSTLQLQGGDTDRLRSEKKSLQSEIATLQASLDGAKRDVESREQQIRWAQTELDELRPLQHQLVNLRSSLSDLVDRDSRGEHASIAHAEIESLRTRIAKLQAESKLNLERKESYYQSLLREKSALIADLKSGTETEA